VFDDKSYRVTVFSRIEIGEGNNCRADDWADWRGGSFAVTPENAVANTTRDNTTNLAIAGSAK
jgi:hypothetical protein